MSKLCTSQKQLTERINKLFANIKKSKSRFTKGYLETRYETLLEYWSTYNKQHETIIETYSEDTLNNLKFDSNAEFDQTEESYLDCKTYLKEALDELSQVSPVLTTSEKESSEKVSRKIKLPPINIPKFSGDYQDWMSFRDIFTSLIHNDANLSKVEKHHYLKSSITAEPEHLLRHFAITESNYEKSWKTLEDRYDNKRIIVNNILNRLLTQKKMSVESARGLKDVLDTTRECLNTLDNLGIDTNTWDAIVVHIVVSKLDLESHKLWEQSLGNSKDIPTFSALASHLENRFRAMEVVTNSRKEKTITKPQSTTKAFVAEVVTLVCTFCKQNHYICHCNNFKALEIPQRVEFVKTNNICFNCLVKGHSVSHCRQSTNCKKCGRRHHTLLHLTNPSKASTATESVPAEPREAVSMKAETSNGQVILATARVIVKSENGNTHELRALIDQGSQASFITESTAQILKMKRISVNGTITGISNDKPITTKSMVNLQFCSIYDRTHIMNTQAYVLTKLTSLLPSQEFPMDTWPLLKTMKLADPHFHQPGAIDILLGAEVHAQIMTDGLHKHNSMIALNSRLGWLISGQVNHEVSHTHQVVVSHLKLETDQLLRKFWELEEHTTKRTLTRLDTQCEEHFKETHTRNTEGRYIVSLPFKNGNDTQLGDTRPIAVGRLHQLERRFKHKPEFKAQYCKFMQQYETQGHMELIPENEINKNVNKKYYLPHHAVLREASTSTKLRVVFDGSAKPEKGKSLNEELLIGPPLQQDIRDLVTRWRMHKICLVADIQQMYRQILIIPEDADYQRILWRENINENIKEYRLLTVTYGTSCAPYLAIRTLHQLSEDEHVAYPDVAPMLKTDLYMDDLLTGASKEDDAIKLQQKITNILKGAGFTLHKWASNSEKVLCKIPSENKANQSVVNIKMDDSIKALGIVWNPQSDCFELKMSLDTHLVNFTKRTVLSVIAKTFDPLGWLAPIVVTLKIFMQKLWLSGLDWDDVLSDDLKTEWCAYHDNLKSMDVIQLPRWLGSLPTGLTIEVHGFCDSSCAAYACVAYLRVLNGDVVTTQLIAARTKVAPVKQVSLPRLELCGAVMLAKMLHEIKTSLFIDDTKVYAWTDSTIVLAWLRKNPNTWSTFIGNRTAEILTVTSCSQWHHVKSAHNPADIASRGLLPSELLHAELWWNGPDFLRTTEGIVYMDVVPETNCELKHKVATHSICTNNNNFVDTHLAKFSSLSKLIRVTAYCLRFVKKCRSKIDTTISTNELQTDYLTVCEIRNALTICIRMSQSVSFGREMDMLHIGKTVPKANPLFTLNPFLDQKKILRVAGRLCNAQVSYELKFPCILSSRCSLAKLIVQEAHIRALHGGLQLTLNVVTTKYYIVGGKNLVKKMIRQCIPCFKQRATPTAPFMGNLPNYRVNPSRCFSSCGVDFAGPFSLKLYSGRCTRTCKAYISLFICTVTKAIHLEVVESLSTAAFLAAFKRFTSRRGHCSDMYSDCGTNFQGASKELEAQFKNSMSLLAQEVSALLANDFTTWHFVPPGAPHFGGLWEAGVKSVKGHLKRVIGQSCLTFNEFSTLLTQVEACVNSRPLTLISSSLEEPPLTPGHFLVGECPITVPEEDLLNTRSSHLDRWHTVQRMLQALWRRWQAEYLTSLQHRYKWNKHQRDIELGTIVLVKDDRLPPGKWLLGRVVEKHPGADGITRVVSLQYKNNIFKRPVTKLCPLPLETRD